jgi:hypothetical protein
MGQLPAVRKAKRPPGEEPVGSHSPDCRTCMPTYHPCSPVPPAQAAWALTQSSCSLGRGGERGVAKVAKAAQTGGEGWRSEPSMAPSTSVYDSGRSEKMREDRKLASE